MDNIDKTPENISPKATINQIIRQKDYENINFTIDFEFAFSKSNFWSIWTGTNYYWLRCL